MTQRLPTPCDSCIFRKNQTQCSAFPSRIPDSILVWGDSHSAPIPGQKNAITWGFKPGSDEEFSEWKSVREQRI